MLLTFGAFFISARYLKAFYLSDCSKPIAAFSMQLKYNNLKVVKAWCMFDWANSVYNLVITTTFFPIYFLAVTKSAYGEENVPFMGRVFKNSALYDYALAFAYLSITHKT